jgi:hypothetical protein
LVLLQRGCCGLVRVREGPCESGQKMMKQLEREKARKREQKHTAEGIL